MRDDLISRRALYEKTAKWEADALQMVEKLSDVDTPAGAIDYFKWSVILAERAAFKHDVADAPAVNNAAEIVRCKDCRRRDVEDTYCPCVCDFVDDDFFCADGLRKEEEAINEEADHR